MVYSFFYILNPSWEETITLADVVECFKNTHSFHFIDSAKF